MELALVRLSFILCRQCRSVWHVSSSREGGLVGTLIAVLGRFGLPGFRLGLSGSGASSGALTDYTCCCNVLLSFSGYRALYFDFS